MNSTSCDSQILVENVASATEEAKEDTAVLVVSEDVLEVYKETETLNEVGEGRVLRKRTIVSTPTTKRKWTRHNQKVPDGLEKELAEVAEENEVATVEVVQELAVTGVGEPEETASVKEDAVAMEELNDEGQQVQEEQPTKETEMAKDKETEVEETVVKEGSSELPDSAETALTEENVVEKVTETRQKDKVADSSDRLSDDEMEEPPVVQRRGLRGRCKVVPQLESTNQSKTHGHEVEHTDEDDLGAGGSAGEEQADEKAMDKQMEENLTVVEEGRIPEAEDITPPTEVSVEECQEVQEEPETASATEMQEEEAEDVVPEPITVTATSGTELSDEMLEETALAGTKEMQETDSCCEISKLHQATVILVDLKATGLHLSVQMAEETSAEGECSAPEREEVELVAPDDKEVSSNSASEQTPEPEMLLLDEEDTGKQENDTEKSADTATGVETSEKGTLKEDSLNEENKESVTLDGEKGEAEEAPIIERRVLRSGRKMVRTRTQELEEGNVNEVDKKKVVEAQADAGEGDGGMEAIETDAVTIADPVEDCLSEQEAGNSEEEERAVTTRTLRKGRKSASASTKSKRKRMCKEIQGVENKEAGDSKSVEVTREKEEAVMGGAVKKSSKEREEQMEEGTASDSQDNLEQTTDVEEEETVAEEGQDDVAEERSEAISNTFAEKEASGEEYDERNAAIVGEETEPPVGSVTRSLRSGGKTPRAPLKHRSRRSTKQPGEEKWEDGTSAEKNAEDHKPPAEPRILRTASVKSQEDGALLETAEKAMAEDDKQDEAELGSAKEPTEDDKGTAQEVDEIQVEMEEPVAVEVEKEVLEKGPTDEDGNAAGVTAAADDLVQEVEACTPSPKPTSNSAVGTPPEEETTTSSEKQHSDLQKVTVVLVDLKSTHHEVQEEMAAGERQAEEEEDQDEEQNQITEHQSGEEFEVADATNVEPETASENVNTGVKDAVTLLETVPDETEAPAEYSVDEEKTSDIADEAITTQGTEEGEPAEGDETKGVSDVDEAPVKETRVLTSGEKADEQEDEATREKSTEAEASVNRRVLRKGRRSAAATPRRKSKRARTRLNTEEEGEDKTTSAEEMQTEALTGLEDSKEGEENKDERTEGKNEDKTGAQTGEKTESEEEQDEEAAGERSADEEPAVETRRVLRKGRRFIAATPQRDSKRGSMRCEEEEEEVETIPAEDLQVEESEAHKTEIGEDPVGQQEETTEAAVELKTVQTVAEQSLPEQQTVEEEQSALLETCANERRETPIGEMNTEEATDEEEPPVVERRVLTSCGEVVKVTSSSQNAQSQQDENKQEGTADKVSSETDEPTAETKVLRKGKRTAAATPRHKAKRGRTRCETEEEGEEEPNPAEQIQVEETNIEEKECSNEEIIEEKDGDGSVAQKEEKTKMEMEDVTVAEESMTEQEPVEEQPADESGQEGAAAGKSSDTDEQAKGRRVLGKKRRSALATPRHKAKRACKRWQAEHEEKERTEGEEEEPGLVKEDKDVKKEVDGEAEGEPAVGDSEEMKDGLTEEAAVPEKEDDSMPVVVETRTVVVKVQETDSAKEEETTVPENPEAAEEGFHSAVAEEEPLVTDVSVSAEEEAPTATSRLLRSKTQSSQATPSRRSSKRSNQGVVEIQQQQVEDEKTQEDLSDELRAEEQAGTDEASLVGLEAENSTEEAEEIADLIDDKESAGEELQELSSVKGNVETSAAESTSEQENTLSLGLSTDDVQVETTGLNQEDEEDEQNMSEEEVEPIVIGKKVLRGRTVPSVTITPQSKSRRHSTKVQKSDERLSYERSPRSLGKRKGAEVTPARKFKRHSRV